VIRRANICPACRRPFPPPLVVTGSVRQRLVNIVSSRPDGIAIGDLVDAVYADDPDGRPVTAPRSVNVMIHKANAQLAAQGYQIKSMWLGRGPRYRIVKIDAGKSEPQRQEFCTEGRRNAPDVSGKL
jgi:hypothetical protein